MQFITEKEATKSGSIRNYAVSIPNSIYASKVLGNDIEIDNYTCVGSLSQNTLLEIWNKQHPLIHTWLILTSISICFLSALFFMTL